MVKEEGIWAFFGPALGPFAEWFTWLEMCSI